MCGHQISTPRAQVIGCSDADVRHGESKVTCGGLACSPVLREGRDVQTDPSQLAFAPPTTVRPGSCWRETCWYEMMPLRSEQLHIGLIVIVVTGEGQALCEEKESPEKQP